MPYQIAPADGVAWFLSGTVLPTGVGAIVMRLYDRGKITRLDGEPANSPAWLGRSKAFR